MTEHTHKGSCLCGSVSFEVAGPLPPASACHCTKCRKSTGHYEAGVDVSQSSVRIYGSENLTWYQSSEKARRGFCRICGSPLFFAPTKGDWIGLSLGAFDGPTNVKIERHIFVANKGDYYEIEKDVPQFDLYPGA